MKVCWISNAPAPYKVAFMNLLGQEVELTCLFEVHAEEDRNADWYDYDSSSFKAIYLDEVDTKKVIQQQASLNDVLINSDYSKGICQYAVSQFHKQGKKTFLHADGGLVIPRGLLDKGISHVMKKNDYFMSSGDETNQYFTYYGVDPTKIHQYHFAIHTATEQQQYYQMHQNKEVYRKENGMKEDVILLSVGSPIPRKGYDILVQAMKEIPQNVGLYIIGGDPESHVRQYVEENNLTNIHFLPFFDKEKLNTYYAAADIFVLPTRYDIWGLVINEAMAFGLPFITTDHCVAGKEFVGKGDCGLLVPIEDAATLKETLETLINDPLKQKDLGNQGYQIIQAYTYETMVKDFLQCLNQ